MKAWMRLSKLHQKFYLYFLTLALIVGMLSAVFSYLINFAEISCNHIFAMNGWLIFIYTPLMFVLIVYLLRRYFPYADGSGIPQGYVIDQFSSKRLTDTYSLRSAFGKAILTFLSVAAGASLGKEGPTIQISSSILSQIPKLNYAKRRLLIKLGAGVGVAAAFNTPLGGMIFALEEYVQQLNARIATLLVGATLVAVFASYFLAGSGNYFGVIEPQWLRHGWPTALLALVLGCCCGVAGAIFTRVVVFISVVKYHPLNRWRRKHVFLNALICGLMVAIIGYCSHGASFGNGASAVRHFLESGTNAQWYFGLAKFVGALFSIAAGVPGGYFSTALAIGCGIGDLIHQLLPYLPLAQFYLIGMTGFLAAITQAPITAAVMVVEMSNSSEFCLPILGAAFIASLIAEYFGESVYHQQSRNYLEPAPIKPQ